MSKKKEKRLIFTDAGKRKTITENGENVYIEDYTISLYDSFNNKSDSIDLLGVRDNNVAELYGILNAIMYVVSNKLERVIILNDNENICNDKVLNEIATKYNIRIHWIPRELNKIADKITKIKPNKKDEYFYILKMYYEIFFTDFKTEIKINITNEIEKKIKSTVESHIKKDLDKEIKSKMEDIKKDLRNGIKNDIKSDILNEVKTNIKKEIKSELNNEIINKK